MLVIYWQQKEVRMKNYEDKVDPKPENGKDINGHNGQENRGDNGNHDGWEKKQTRSHGMTCVGK
jgi:hypothetical protein